MPTSYFNSFLRLESFLFTKFPGAGLPDLPPFCKCTNISANAIPASRVTLVTYLSYAYFPSCLLFLRIRPFHDLFEAQYGIPASVPSRTAISGFIQKFGQLADLTVHFIFIRLQALRSLDPFVIRASSEFSVRIFPRRPYLPSKPLMEILALGLLVARAGIEAVRLFKYHYGPCPIHPFTSIYGRCC